MSNTPQLPRKSIGLTFFHSLLWNAKAHPWAPGATASDRPEPSQKRRACRSCTELLAAKLAEGNDVPREGMGWALQVSREEWAVGGQQEWEREVEEADFPGSDADRAGGSRLRARHGEFNQNTSVGAAQDCAVELRAYPEACSSATMDAAPAAKSLWEALYFWSAHLYSFSKSSQAWRAYPIFFLHPHSLSKKHHSFILTAQLLLLYLALAAGEQVKSSGTFIWCVQQALLAEPSSVLQVCNTLMHVWTQQHLLPVSYRLSDILHQIASSGSGKDTGSIDGDTVLHLLLTCLGDQSGWDERGISTNRQLA